MKVETLLKFIIFGIIGWICLCLIAYGLYFLTGWTWLAWPITITIFTLFKIIIFSGGK